MGRRPLQDSDLSETVRGGQSLDDMRNIAARGYVLRITYSHSTIDSRSSSIVDQFVATFDGCLYRKMFCTSTYDVSVNLQGVNHVFIEGDREGLWDKACVCLASEFA
jgi:hypothetical protein